MNKDVVQKLCGFSLPTFISAFIGILSTPIVTRIFEASELGRINLFIAYLTLSYTFCLLGLDQSFIRFYSEPPEYENKYTLFSACFKLSLITALIFCIVLLVFRSRISNLVSSSYDNYIISFYLCIALIGSIFNRFLQSVSRMEEDIFKYSIQAVGYVIVTKLAFIIAAYFNPYHTTAIGIISIGCILLGGLFLFIEKSKIFWRRRVNKNTAFIILKYGVPLMPGIILILLNNSISQILMSRLLDYATVGVYSSAITIANLISLIQSGFNTYWAAFVWKNYKKEQKTIQHMHHIITFVMSIFALNLILFQDFLFLILGENYRAGKSIFSFLIVSPICYTISETTGLGIGISKKSYLNTFITAITLFLNVVLCIGLIPIFGMCGGAVSSSICGVLYLLMRTLIGEKYYKCINDKVKTWVSIAIVISGCVISYSFQSNILIRTLLCFILIVVLLFSYLSYVHKFISIIVRKNR